MNPDSNVLSNYTKNGALRRCDRMFGNLLIMLAKILSGALVGLEARLVTVEVDIASQGLPSFTIVGLPDKAVDEAKERVRAAIKNSGATFPAKRITVNLAPADLPKFGPMYDVPIAIGILIASGQLTGNVEKLLFMGELSLDGSLRHTNGVLPITLLAKNHNIPAVFIPEIDAPEAALVSDIDVLPAASLLTIHYHLSGSSITQPLPHAEFESIFVHPRFDSDMSEIAGQEQVKRALEIAAAGGHNVFMQGLPGAGKTLLARTMPTILPHLSEEEALEVTKIYSVTGNLPSGQSLVTSRPFRSPHHTTSRIGLIGGGTNPNPGEISLAHRGVLFLDEFPEFPRHVLESLRQPMEDGHVSISRAAGTVTFPSKFMLVGAANPCPCGNFGNPLVRCTCLASTIFKYQKRISGPLMERIDLHVFVPAVSVDKLTSNTTESESSKSIQSRVQAARKLQQKRFIHTNFMSNAEMSNAFIKANGLNYESESFLRKAVKAYSLSARSYYRVLKISRTIADLENRVDINIHHIAEALQYRPKND